MMYHELSELRQRNLEREQLLQLETRKEIKQMLCYMNIAKMGVFDREIVRQDLIGMALEAKIREESFSDMIGENKQEWCDNVLRENGRISKYELILDIISTLLIYVSGIGILKGWFSPSLVPILGGDLYYIFFLGGLCVLRELFLAPLLAYCKNRYFYGIIWILGLVLYIVFLRVLPFSKTPIFMVSGIVSGCVPLIFLFLVYYLQSRFYHKEAEKYNWNIK